MKRNPKYELCKSCGYSALSWDLMGIYCPYEYYENYNVDTVGCPLHENIYDMLNRIAENNLSKLTKK